MAKFNIEVELDWMDEEGRSIDDELRYAVTRGVKDELLKKSTDEIMKKLDAALAEKIDESIKEIEKRVDDFIEVICSENISKIIIPRKKSTWSDEVENIPITEFIGEKFADAITKKVYNKNFKSTSYDGEKMYSMAEKCIVKYLRDTLQEKIETMVHKAQSEAETAIVKGLETTLKENLAKETIERMNIPEVLKKLENMSLLEVQ